MNIIDKMEYESNMRAQEKRILSQDVDGFRIVQLVASQYMLEKEGWRDKRTEDLYNCKGCQLQTMCRQFNYLLANKLIGTI